MPPHSSIFRETGERYGEAWALNGLGEAAHAAGHPDNALGHHTAAHTIAADIDAPDQQARAHTGLGHAHQTLGDLVQARHHWQLALALYDDFSPPQADEIRARLTTVDNDQSDSR